MMKHLISGLAVPGQYPEEKTKPRVLIVEDEPIIGNLLEAGLTEAGFEASYFSTGAEALDSVHRLRPDIIISDTVMSPMDAYELRRRVRLSPLTARIPFIFLSSNHSSVSDFSSDLSDRSDFGPGRGGERSRTETSDQSEGLRNGPDDYIYKPFKMENLIERVKAVMDRCLKSENFWHPAELSPAEFSADKNPMNINDIVNTAAADRKSGALVFTRAKDGEKIGTAFFSEGKIINAISDTLEGEEAFYSLMDQGEDKTFRFYESDHKSDSDSAENSILINTEALMQQCARLRDEAEKLYARLPDLNVVPRIISDPGAGAQIPPSVSKVGREKLMSILALISEKKTVKEIIGSRIMSRLSATALLHRLFEAGVVAVSAVSGEGCDPAPSSLPPAPCPLPPAPCPLPISEDFLKMLRSFEQGRLSGMLTVRERPDRTAIWFDDGSIVSAVHGNTVGKKALYRIFSDSISEENANPRFKVQPFTDEKTVEGSLNDLIEEGSREIAKFRELKPATFASSVTINQESLRKTSKLNGRPGLNHILSLAQKYSLVGDIVAMSRMTDFQAYRHLFYLVKQGILTVGQKHRPEIQIITDSAADLPSDMHNTAPILVIPLSVTQAVGVSPRAYPPPGGVSNSGAGVSNGGAGVSNDRGVSTGVYPYGGGGTGISIDGAPTPEDFHDMFSQMIPRKDILAIFSSGKISGCFENALAAKKKYAQEYSRLRQQSLPSDPDPHFEIEIIDSRQLSAACCLLVAEAADRIEEGWEIGRIAQHIRKIIPLIRIFLYPRVRTGSVFSRIMGVGPVLSLWNGELTVIDQVRGRKNAGARILEWIEQGLDNAAVPVKVGIMHADVPGWAVFMREQLKQRFNCREVIISRVSPSGGSCCGAGTVAVAYFPVPDPEQIVFKSYGPPL